MRRTRLLAAASLPLVLALAACSSGGGATASPTSAAPSTAANPSSPAGPSEAASPAGSGGTASEDYPLKASADGSYLTGKNGMALYIFKKDTKDSGKSVCNGQCLANWPAYDADQTSEIEAEGASGTLSIITRDDGSKQLAYNGLPLYYFAGDKAAGDTNGKAIPNWALATP
jgi:predicted lipoprotein with Yx(FWY)xxD motif